MSKAGFGNYLSKPRQVQAWKFNCLDEASLLGLRKWVEEAGAGVYYWSKFPVQGGGFGLEIENKDGKRFLVKDGEYVVKGSDNKFISIESEDFLSTFERI